jgi:hypothetical protein
MTEAVSSPQAFLTKPCKNSLLENLQTQLVLIENTNTLLFLMSFCCFVYLVVIKALPYKPEDCGVETLWGQWCLSIYVILPASRIRLTTSPPRLGTTLTRIGQLGTTLAVTSDRRTLNSQCASVDS